MLSWSTERIAKEHGEQQSIARAYMTYQPLLRHKGDAFIQIWAPNIDEFGYFKIMWKIVI